MFRELWIEHQEKFFTLGKSVLISLVILLVAWVICQAARKLIVRSVKKVEHLSEAVGKVSYSVVRFLIWAVAVLIIMDQFGVNTSSILTLLGAIGLAIGLALKDSLGNVAAGLMLLVLRPYKFGDYVDCGTASGTVKFMGLFATELMTADGMFVMVPNSVILGTPVKNYSRNPLRRADITVGIAYTDSLSVGVKVLQELLDKNERIQKNPAPEVLVTDLADNSVNLTLRFWVDKDNFWQVYWEVKKQLKPAIEGAGLNIPFPQRVITLANAGEIIKK